MTSGVVLAFDTATAATVVGVSVNGEVVGQLADRPEADERPRHAERLLTLGSAGLTLTGLALGWDRARLQGYGSG